jgi:hypothetical protein
MLTEICAELHNYFSNEDDRHIGDFEIVGGSIVPSISIQNGQYYRIVGSVFNDGVHQYGDSEDVLQDEPEFHGAVWLMRVPKDVIELAEQIKMWQNAYEGVDSPNMSPYQSESFGGYSYSKKSSSSGGGSGNYSWKDAFAMHLNRYRKIRAV